MNPFLGRPVPDANDWRTRAVCGRLDNNHELIHDVRNWHPEGDRMQREAMRTRAVRMCAACPVARECFAYAINNGEEWGIYGGVDIEQERRRAKDTQKKWQTLARRTRRDIELGVEEARRRAEKRAYDAARNARKKAALEAQKPTDLTAALEAQRDALDAIVKERLA